MPFMAAFAPLVGNHFYNCMTFGYFCAPYQKRENIMRKLFVRNLGHRIFETENIQTIKQAFFVDKNEINRHI